MKKIILCMMLLIGASTLKINAQANKVSAEEYMQKLVDTKNEYLIDVRTPAEFEKEHLNNAINIDYNAGDFEANIEKLDKSRPVFIYCLSGGRSGNAIDVFAKNGFTNVTNMNGGILQWKSKNYPLNTTKSAVASSWIGMTKEEYNILKSGEVPVLIDFKAAWCGPCKMLKPILDEIQTEYEGKVKVIFIDVDKNKSLADEMKIKSIPLMIYYKNGKVAMNIEGFADKSSIIKSLKLNK